MSIGFITFTKAARHEAADRAGKKFGYSAEELEQGGYFRTLHSMCYMLLGTRGDSMITDNKESCDWIANALGEPVADTSDLGGSDPFQGRSDSEIALGLWHCSRNKLEGFDRTWEKADSTDERTPPLSVCRKYIDSYEHHKRLDGRLDFTDLLGKFAGVKFRIDGPESTEPEGEIPPVEVWFLDECQDNSALTDAVARRLVARSKWVYLVADPFQAIYGWAGADAKHFMSWPVAKDKIKILQQTYRCPEPVISLGENILRECSDYWDRGIRPASHAGKVDFITYQSPWIDELDPNDDWLLIARTNFQAATIAKRLDAANVPWKNTGKGNNKWNAPVKNRAIVAMKALEGGYAISGEEWKVILKNINNKPGQEYFVRGTKKEWQAKSGDGMFIDLEHIDAWGATEAFKNMILQRYWHKFINGSADYLDAIKRWGHDAVENSKIRVGTVHSVKGSEADNVLLLTTTSHQIEKGQEDAEGYNEERRVEYVAVTRARHNLFICSEKKPKFSMLREVL